MEIAVLIKQVPATESLITIAEDGKSLKTDGVKWVINPYDEFAVEEALRIKEAKGGTVTVISLGTDKTVEALRTAMAMGADKAVLVKDPALDACDGLGTARVLAAALKQIPFDLVIAGQRAIDDDNFLVGPAVAEFLDIPHISFVIRAELSDGRIRCQKTVEGGTVVMEAPLPALVTTQRGLNEPRYASLPGIMKAKKKPIDTRTPADLGVDPASLAPRVKILSLSPPPERKGGRIIQGETAQVKAAELVRALREDAKVI